MRNNKFTIDCPNCSTEITTVISSVGTRNSGISYSEIMIGYDSARNDTGGVCVGGLIYGNGGVGRSTSSDGQSAPSKEDTIDEIKNLIQDHKHKIQKLKRSLVIVRKSKYPKGYK